MCTVCGCESGNKDHAHDHAHHHHHHGHAHSEHEMGHTHHELHFGANEARASVSGFDTDQLITIEKNILDKNQLFAQQNRSFFQANHLFAINLLSSPGAGKTSLLVKTIENLSASVPIYVVEGDQETANDAQRIRATGVAAVQINTGKGCHLDAHMVGHALEKFKFDAGGLLIIENVGNLVCPAAFDLGEAHKVVILSVTEGEDKPIKYPDMFAAADLMVVSKTDLLPYLRFDVDRAIEYARRVNPDLQVLQLSVESGDGMQAWNQWLMSAAQAQMPIPAPQSTTLSGVGTNA